MRTIFCYDVRISLCFRPLNSTLHSCFSPFSFSVIFIHINCLQRKAHPLELLTHQSWLRNLQSTVATTTQIHPCPWSYINMCLCSSILHITQKGQDTLDEQNTNSTVSVKHSSPTTLKISSANNTPFFF